MLRVFGYNQKFQATLRAGSSVKTYHWLDFCFVGLLLQTNSMAVVVEDHLLEFSYESVIGGEPSGLLALGREGLLYFSYREKNWNLACVIN